MLAANFARQKSSPSIGEWYPTTTAAEYRTSYDSRVTVERMRMALEGLATGDCFGEQLFGEREKVLARIAARDLRPGPWRYTDDTEMAVSIAEMLAERGSIDQDLLVERFASRMEVDRGYGRGAFEILEDVRRGRPWRHAVRASFDGMGSFGNGAAMRAAPLGAFFADQDLSSIVEQARLSAEVTHAHPEGIAGGIAVAVAAALAWRNRGATLGADFIRAVNEQVPKGYTHDAIAEAEALPVSTSIDVAAKTLGNGSAVTAPDTVPLCLWIVAHESRDFERALWKTVSALGDRDTTCAIVGGILGARLGVEAIPAAWRTTRERVPWLDH
jgi:ADP-ribosylglycohydrolase